MSSLGIPLRWFSWCWMTFLSLANLIGAYFLIGPGKSFPPQTEDPRFYWIIQGSFSAIAVLFAGGSVFLHRKFKSDLARAVPPILNYVVSTYGMATAITLKVPHAELPFALIALGLMWYERPWKKTEPTAPRLSAERPGSPG